MSNYLLAYTGASMPDSPDQAAAVMAAWESWFASLGPAVVDPGAPFGPSATIAPDGSTGQTGTGRLSGYTVLTAESLTAAVDLAKGCPVLASGASIEVYEAMPM